MFRFLPNRSINHENAGLVSILYSCFAPELGTGGRGETLLCTCWLQGAHRGSPPKHQGSLLPLNVWGGFPGLLVLLLSMRDDVTQVLVIQVTARIWWESRKHLLDLGKE